MTEPCSNREFQRVKQKSFHTLRIFVSLHGLVIWKVIRRNVWSENLSWQTRRHSNSTKYLLHALMTITSKKNWNMLGNCQKYALKLFENAYTWQELDDLIFYGQWINLHDPSQNGPRPVTNAWIDWYHIFIIHVNTNNIVMWVILPNNADSDCFKILVHRHQKPTCRYPNQSWHVMKGIIFCACSISAISVFTFCSETMAKRLPTRFRRRTSHSKIATNDEPGEEKLWKSKFLEYNYWERGKTGETRYRHRPKESFRLLLSWTIYWKLFFSKLFKVGW